MIREIIGTMFDIADRVEKRKKKDRVARPFLVEPLRTSDPSVAPKLVKLIRSGAGVPLVRCDGDDVGMLRTFWRWARFALTTQEITEKPPFEVTRWRHRPVDDFGGDLVEQDTAGSVLFVDLDSTESREHFIHSTRPGLSAARRLVAILTPADLCDPTAWVRCVWVNAFAASPVSGSQTGVILPSSWAIDPAKAATTRMRQCDIPPEAMWLICDSDHQGAPETNWGEKEEGYDAAPRPAAPFKHERRLKGKAKWRRIYKLVMWVVAGAGPAAFGISALGFSGDLDATETGLLAGAVIWGAAMAVVAACAAWAITKDKCLTLLWRWRERGRPERWQKGTARGLLLSELLREVSVQPDRTWDDLWASTFQEAAPAGVGKSQSKKRRLRNSASACREHHQGPDGTPETHGRPLEHQHGPVSETLPQPNPAGRD